MHARILEVMAATVIAAGAALLSFAPTANATPFAFNFSDVVHGVTITGTIDVVGGIATNGTGTINGPPLAAWDGDAITLMSPPTARWGGTDLNIDNLVPLNGNGLLFGVGPTGVFAGTTTGYEWGLNIWSNGGSSYTAFLAGANDGTYVGYDGTFSYPEVAAAVPGPVVGAGIPGLIAGCFTLLGLARRRRRQAVA